MNQEFKPVAIGGSVSGRAHAIAEDIASNDYHVADYQLSRREGIAPTVRYKDQTRTSPPASWGAAQQAIEGAIAAGRANRLQYGSGLDVLQANLKNGVEPDLIANSKKRMIKLY